MKFPSVLASLDSSAFADCKNLETVDFTAVTKLTSFGLNAFQNSSVIAVGFGAGVTRIPNDAFSDCKNLKGSMQGQDAPRESAGDRNGRRRCCTN